MLHGESVAVGKTKTTIIRDVRKEPLVIRVEGCEGHLHDRNGLDDLVRRCLHHINAIGGHDDLDVPRRLRQRLVA